MNLRLSWINSASDADLFTYQQAVDACQRFGFTNVTLIHMSEGFAIQNDMDGTFLSNAL